jgi:hypothetical protein
MSAIATTAAVRAIAGVLAQLDEAGIAATRDAGAFYPQPVGVLVTLPALTSRTLYGRSFEVPVLVVSGDPLNDELPVNRIYALADEVALALSIEAYRPSSYRSSANAEPLPALELVAVVTVTETEGS